jgi:hypothetical protein
VRPPLALRPCLPACQLLTRDPLSPSPLSRPTDRRAHMEKLSAALGLPFTFMSAISTGHSVVPWILERLLDDQEQAEHTASGLKAFVPSADWNGTGGTW